MPVLSETLNRCEKEAGKDHGARFRYLLQLANTVDRVPSLVHLQDFVARIRKYWQPSPLQLDAISRVIGIPHGTTFLGGFAKGSSPLSFSRFHRKLIALQLIVRVANPNLILQRKHPLCGPTTFIQSVARENPVSYVNYVIGLATTRTGSLKTSSSTQRLRVHVRSKSNILHKHASHLDIPEADYVALASLRNSENILPYRGWWLNQTIQGGTTAGDLIKWMQRAGFRHVENHTHLFDPAWSLGIGGKNRVEQNLLRAQQKLAGNAPHTIIVIGSSAGKLAHLALNDGKKDSFFDQVFGAHVVLLRGVQMTTTDVAFDVITWGKESDQTNLVKIPWSKVRSRSATRLHHGEYRHETG
jgi:hypothetical protein